MVSSPGAAVCLPGEGLSSLLWNHASAQKKRYGFFCEASSQQKTVCGPRRSSVWLAFPQGLMACEEAAQCSPS